MDKLVRPVSVANSSKESSAFSIVSNYSPAGDQPKAIAALKAGVDAGKQDQVLLGVTGSGKTFTMANLIAETGRPALVMAHNKTLAAQLYGELKDFLPNNAVEYFVSYYDYYQPEAYIPRSDVYIEKDSSINEQIDRMRHSATRALLERRDVVVVASVSCIYGLGDVSSYAEMAIPITKGKDLPQAAFIKNLVELQYSRNDIAFERGTFRVRGDTIDIFPAHYEDRAWRLSLFGDEVEGIVEFDPLTGEQITQLESVTIYANSHFVTPRPTLNQAIKYIREEMKERVTRLHAEGKLLEAQRLEQRTMYDLEMLQETGSCKGIENYSRYLSGRKAGEPPPTLFEYLPDDALLFIDESHVTVSQIGAMYKGDRSRKATLVEYGFRLPSALDNRPLQFDEWDGMRPQTVFVSATPAPFELERAKGECVEQIIRPTGLVDPVCEIRPVASQVDDLVHECRAITKSGGRILVTTLTKKMSEHLTEYMHDNGLKVRYLHSDIHTLERMDIIRDLRAGVFDILIGINLLREGLDIPECMLVAILDADKEGFLRSKTSLIQTIGRAARNVGGKVILYADKMTNSLTAALEETDRRRAIQQAYNEEHGITPQTIIRSVHATMSASDDSVSFAEAAESGSMSFHAQPLTSAALVKHVEALRKQMLAAASNLEFERASELRDEIKRLEESALELFR